MWSSKSVRQSLLGNNYIREIDPVCQERSDNPLFGGGEGGGIIKGTCHDQWQATVRKKQASLPAFFVPGAGM